LLPANINATGKTAPIKQHIPTILSLLLSPESPAVTRIIDKLPDTTENIHTFQIFNYHVKDPQDEAGKVDLVWGSDFPTQPEGVFNTYYFPWDRAPGIKVDGVLHDLAWFQANHPDWIVYTCDKTTPAWAFKNTRAVPLDITNPAVLEYIMQTYLVPAIQQGYQGIAFDNIMIFYNSFNRCGVWRNGEWVQQFTGAPNEAAFLASILSWAEWAYTRLHALDTAVLINFSYDFRLPDASNKMYRYMDVAAPERGFTNGDSCERGHYLSDDTWLTNMRALQALDANGKGFAAMNCTPVPFAQVTQEQKQWILANYLLVKGKHSYVAITGIQEYGRILTAPEYSAPIGHAVNTMYESQGVYMRDFSNGKAMVNPSKDISFTVSLPAGVYEDLYGQSLNDVTLEARSGIVLLRK